MPSTEGAGRERLEEPAAVRALAVDIVARTPAARLPLEDAAGLVLAEPLTAPFDLPRFDNSAMDGYAVRSEDSAPAPARLRVAGRSVAGRPFEGTLRRGEAVVIATGAVLPPGADAVVPVEEVSEDHGGVVVPRPVEPGRHVRRAGEDVRRGAEVLPAGTVLGPGQLAAAAALGTTEVAVHRPPVVAVLPTGDEVRPPGEPLGPGQVHDAVSLALVALLRETGAVARRHPPAPDEPAALRAAIRGAAAGADLVLSVGGVSMGERDLVGQLGVEARGWAFRVALRPAKPFAVATVFGVPLFGLPGNPAAALAAFEELVRPAVLAMLGREPAGRVGVAAVLRERVQQRPGRLHLLRAEVWREEGRLHARPAGAQGAGMIHSLARATAWAVVPADRDEVAAGEEIEVRLLVDPSPSARPSEGLAAVVLCGGRSSRMGFDKALLEVAGEPLVARVAGRIGRAADPVLLAPGRPGRLGDLGLPEVGDEVADAGPLGGLAAALSASPRPLLAAVAVDLPFASAEVLRLLASVHAGEDAVVPVTTAGPQPLHAVYARSCLPAVRGALARGRRALHDLLPGLRVRYVREQEWSRVYAGDRFALNLNRREDLAQLPPGVAVPASERSAAAPSPPG